MHKNALFLKKLENCRSVGGSSPKSPLASGGWELRPQTPSCYSHHLLFSRKAFVAITSLLSKGTKRT